MSSTIRTDQVNPEELADLFRVDVVTGRRTHWKTLTPSNPVGVEVNGASVVVAADRSAYCYSFFASNWAICSCLTDSDEGAVPASAISCSISMPVNCGAASSQSRFRRRRPRLLQILVSERPKALSKMELQERLWHPFVVEKTSSISSPRFVPRSVTMRHIPHS